MANEVFIPAVVARANPWEEPDIQGRSRLILIHRARKHIAVGVQEENSSTIRHYKNEIRLFYEVLKKSSCVDKKHSDRRSPCSCIKDHRLSEGEAVAMEDYLYSFACLSKSEQQTLVVEWIKYGENIGLGIMQGQPGRLMKYLLPGTRLLICKDALSRILGYGQTAWQTVTNLAKSNAAPQHGLLGNTNAKNDHLNEVLEEFFNELAKQAQP
jgi:hypothetical protein